MTFTTDLRALLEKSKPEQIEWYQGAQAVAIMKLDIFLRNHAERIAAVVEAAEQLVKDIETVTDSEQYRAVFVLAKTHGDIYRNGPTMCPNRLIAALAELEKGQ